MPLYFFSLPRAGSSNERQVVHRLCKDVVQCAAVHCTAVLNSSPANVLCAFVWLAGSINERQWYTDYAKMSFSALLFYGYVFVLGLILYFALRWFK
jgi:ABC-type enterobactin transport system permease subunit